MPERILDNPTLILLTLVSSFLPDVTQQIHSLRASGVSACHFSANAGSPSSIASISGGVG